jgi:hypothetical protein
MTPEMRTNMAPKARVRQDRKPQTAKFHASEQLTAVQSGPFGLQPELQGQLQCVEPHPPEQVGPSPPVACMMVTHGGVVVVGVVFVTGEPGSASTATAWA